MRIIGGKYSGRPLIAPKGRDTRPTADRTRESVFNILTYMDDVAVDGARVIDLFAGSGAFGFEAMSRNASFCLFVEIDSAARGAIRTNAEALNLFGATRIHRRSATSLGDKPAGVGPAFTLAFLDPPYGKNLARSALCSLKTGGWLADSALIVIEQGKDEEEVVVDGFSEDDRRHYGAAQIGFYRFRA